MRFSSLVLVAAVLAALALAAGASAAAPRFALFDVQQDLAHASHNTFGDVKVWKRQAALESRAAGSAIVRCGNSCTYGAGWLAFSASPALSTRDVTGAKAHRTKIGWSVVVTLTPRGVSRLEAFSRRAALSGSNRGVPDALAVVLAGEVVAQPLMDQLRRGKTSVELPGLSRANARRAAKLLRR
jgi:preprotein translocase subunit SecD